jgi:hypothetical protein
MHEVMEPCSPHSVTEELHSKMASNECKSVLHIPTSLCINLFVVAFDSKFSVLFSTFSLCSTILSISLRFRYLWMV